MTAFRWMGVLALIVATLGRPLAAQGRGQRGAQRGMIPRQALVQQIDQLFLKRAVNVMALTDDQVPRFQRVVSTWGARRAGLEADERLLRQSLNAQLRPGIAANADSVGRLVDALNGNRVTYAETFRDEMRELTPILSPVQRGQFQILRDQLLQKVRDLQQQRAAGVGDPLGAPEP